MSDDQQWATNRRKAIGNRVREARQAAGLTQEPLALRIGLDRRTIQRIESACTDARLSWLLLIARALDVPLA